MARIEKTVFISYRRTNLPWARAVYQDLTSHGYDTFFDFQSIDSGDFSQAILENIKGRAHFVILLTPSALEHCNDQNDWLRREIETAIDEKRNIVPLMLENFDFGSPANSKYLTGKLSLLKRYNGLRIYSDYFDEGMVRLREKFLNVALNAVLHPISASVKQKTGKQQQAERNEPAVKQKELSAQEWFERGFKLENNNDEKIHCYTEAIRLKPDYADAYINRGIARRDEGDMVGAVKDYTEAIHLKPNDAVAYYNRGISLNEKGDMDGAFKDYTEAIRLKPNDADAYCNRGIVRKDKDDMDGALKDYTEAIRIKPDYINAYYNRAFVWKKKDDAYAAIADYKKYLDLGGGLRDGDQAKVEGFIQDLKKKIK